MLNNRSIIGYLSKEGKFYTCNSWGHSALAQSLCEQFKLKNEDGSVPVGLETEYAILNHGFICFRARDAYMHYYSQSMGAVETNSHSDRKMNFITAEQMAFIEANQSNWNNIDQAECVREMVETSEGLKERYERQKKKEQG